MAVASGSRDRVQHGVGHRGLTNGIEVVELTGLKLIGAGHFEQCPIAGFGCYLGAMAAEATESTLLIEQS
jgi:hypothetical protein